MDDPLSQARARVAELARRPEAFLQVQTDAFEAAKLVAKALYDLAKSCETDAERAAMDTMPELIVEDFDEEQVWAGVDMQNKARFDVLCARVNSLARHDGFNLLLGTEGDSSRKRKLDPVGELEDSEMEDEMDEEEEESSDLKRVRFEDEDEGEEEEVEEEEEEGEDDEEDADPEDDDPILNDPDFQNMSDSDGDDLPLFENARSEDEEESDGGEDLAKVKKADVDTKTDAYMEGVMKTLRGHRQEDQVEDKFFKLTEMEAFLEKEDAHEERRRLREEKGMGDESDDEEALDLFGETGGSEEDERAHYKDYFSAGGGDAAAGSEDDKSDSGTSTPAGLLGDEQDDGEEKDLGEIKSTFEETQLRLKKRIKKMEEEAVSTKPWQLSGEIAGPARPENSLLQEHLDYDSVARMAPIITEAVSKRLEDIIVQRIKDKVWDDVERKIKPLEDPYEYKKKLVLDHEKSKLSLAQIYENEFLQQQSKLEDGQKVRGLLDDEGGETPKEVVEIQRDMKKLFAKLDTLTHFHYTPKSLSTEVKIIRNLPSIAMEEVAPVASSDATLLAPQEVVDSKKGEMIGSSERSETDMKRERRKKKSKQRAVQNEKEKRKKLVDKLNPGLGNKYSKKKMMHDIKEAEKKGHLTTIKDKGQGKVVKSSAAFFNQLQHETSAFIKDKAAGGKGKKRSGKEAQAANLKL